MSADRFDVDALSHVIIMLALADGLLHFASSLLHIIIHGHIQGGKTNKNIYTGWSRK